MTGLFDRELPHPPPETGDGDGEALTVSRLNELVKGSLEGEFPAVAVRGEIANLRIPSSGHAYFTLKDAGAEVQAVFFRQRRLHCRVPLEDGREIIARGGVTLYAARGTYQIMVESVAAKGKGDLREQLEKLTNRLREEGLFDPARKRPIPRLPRVVGVITSRTGAAVRDILRVIRDRFPGAHVVLGDVPVQGAEAAPAISRMLDLFNAWGGADVLIVGRGGGSLEDLWAFNEESVARAIHRSRTPVISAVGHEIDVTIADLVADLRAPTPTAAAEMAVPDAAEENQRLDDLAERVRLAARQYLDGRRSDLAYYRHHRVFAAPGETLRAHQRTMTDYGRRLRAALAGAVQVRRARVEGAEGRIASLNPLAVLKRGFSFTTDAAGRRVTDAADLKAGDRLRTRLARGMVVSAVEGTIPSEIQTLNSKF